MICDRQDVSVTYVNTKGYGHAEYRKSNKKFFDIVFYDDDKGWAEVCCIPKSAALWDRAELLEICEKRGIKKGISYLSNKGISFKYRFGDDENQDSDSAT